MTWKPARVSSGLALSSPVRSAGFHRCRVRHDLRLTKRMWKKAGTIVTSERHGHNRQDGSFEVEKQKILECGDEPA